MSLPPVQYANNEGFYLAYRTVGEGADVVFTPPATVTMDLSWPWMQRLGAIARVTWYDKRGTGASDGAANFSFEERMDDIGAVMDAAGIGGAHLIGASEGGPLSILFAASHPERVRSLTLVGTFPSWMKRRDYPHGRDMTMTEYSRFVDRVVAALTGDRDHLSWFWDMWAPGLAATPGFLDMIATLNPSTSPGATRLIWEAMYEADVRTVLPSIQIPTTVVHRRGDRVAPIEGARYLARHIPGASLVEIDGDDHFALEIHPEIVEAVASHIANTHPESVPSFDRRLTTVLFTDIVNSTMTAAGQGDQAWTSLLDRHDGIARRQVGDHGGRIVKTTGDGMLAIFDGPSQAIAAAAAIHAAMPDLGITVRAGVHVGEVEIRSDGDIAGIGVHIAARIAALAGADETFVSRTVKDLVVGSDLRFDDLGEHHLKGVQEPWPCYAVRAANHAVG